MYGNSSPWIHPCLCKAKIKRLIGNALIKFFDKEFRKINFKSSAVALNKSTASARKTLKLQIRYN